MAIETCGRCGSQSAKLLKCDYCTGNMCNSCIRSSKRKKIDHRRICKGCWTDMRKRNTFKGAN
jgi:hypothetical protein